MSLFNPIEPYAIHSLDVGDGHVLYVEESGNPTGIPVIRLHGGPGSASKASYRQLLDPAVYRMVTFDQRGCGKSTCEDVLRANDTAHLVGDIETIREFLGVKVWGAVVGYSWGSTLGVVYAEAHPDRVASLAVGAVLLASQEELDWFYKPGSGLSMLYPTAYAAVREALGCPPEAMPERLFELLTGPDAAKARAAAVAVMRLDMLSCDVVPDEAAIEAVLADEAYPIVQKTLVWSFYFRNQCFVDAEALLARVGERLKGVPVSIVQGAMDTCCPPRAAVRLHAAIPGSVLHMVPGCGHLPSREAVAVRMHAVERGIWQALALGRCTN